MNFRKNSISVKYDTDSIRYPANRYLKPSAINSLQDNIDVKSFSRIKFNPLPSVVRGTPYSRHVPFESTKLKLTLKLMTDCPWRKATQTHHAHRARCSLVSIKCWNTPLEKLARVRSVNMMHFLGPPRGQPEPTLHAAVTSRPLSRYSSAAAATAAAGTQRDSTRKRFRYFA